MISSHARWPVKDLLEYYISFRNANRQNPGFRRGTPGRHR